MANLAVVLKDEIRRLARKEIRTQMGSTAKAVSRYRREIAQLKQRIALQERKLATLETRGPAASALEARGRKSRQAASEASNGGELSGVRFSARSVKAQRTRLGLSAQDYSALVGVSPLTIYNWEHGKSRPRQSQLASLVAVRDLGKREAIARLEQLRGGKKTRGRQPR